MPDLASRSDLREIVDVRYKHTRREVSVILFFQTDFYGPTDHLPERHERFVTQTFDKYIGYIQTTEKPHDVSGACRRVQFTQLDSRKIHFYA